MRWVLLTKILPIVLLFQVIIKFLVFFIPKGFDLKLILYL